MRPRSPQRRQARRDPSRIVVLIALALVGSASVWFVGLRLQQSLSRWGCVETEDHVDRRFFDPEACVTVDQRQRALTELIRTLAGILDGLDIDYWLDSGTLLGQFRTQSVIPWDTDADFGILRRGYEQLRDLSSPLRDLPVERFALEILNSQLYGGGGVDGAGPPTDDDLEYARDLNIPIRLIDRASGFYVDVFVFEETVVQGIPVLSTTPSSSWHTCARCLEVGRYTGWLVLPRSYVYPLLRCDFANFRVLCPARRTRYLEHLYGPDFRQPQRRSH